MGVAAKAATPAKGAYVTLLAGSGDNWKGVVGLAKDLRVVNSGDYCKGVVGLTKGLRVVNSGDYCKGVVLFVIAALLLAGPVAVTAEETVDIFPLAPPGASPRRRLHASAIAAIALAAVVVVAAGVVFGYICCCRRNEEDEDRAVRPGDLQLVVVGRVRA